MDRETLGKAARMLSELRSLEDMLLTLAATAHHSLGIFGDYYSMGSHRECVGSLSKADLSEMTAMLIVAKKDALERLGVEL